MSRVSGTHSGGWRLHGRDATVAHRHKPVRIGYDYLHVAIDDRTRLAYVEALPDERDGTCAEFLYRAIIEVHRQVAGELGEPGSRSDGR